MSTFLQTSYSYVEIRGSSTKASIRLLIPGGSLLQSHGHDLWNSWKLKHRLSHVSCGTSISELLRKRYCLLLCNVRNASPGLYDRIKPDILAERCKWRPSSKWESWQIKINTINSIKRDPIALNTNWASCSIGMKNDVNYFVNWQCYQ